MRTYDTAVARQLLEMAFPEWEYPPYLIDERGVYQSEDHRALSPDGEVFDWTPAYDMTWKDAPNPLVAPMLPIPFTAAELTAFMLDGAGAMIPEALACPLGCSIKDSPKLPANTRLREVREALLEAYELAAETLELVGAYDKSAEEHSQLLLSELEKAEDEALRREGVFADGLDQDEQRTRRSRAAASVKQLKDRADGARDEAKEKWQAWRSKMVRYLLGPNLDHSSASPSNAESGTDTFMLATAEELIDAFGPSTGMTSSWFRNLTDKPRLLEARVEKGRGGRSRIQKPRFCTYKVLLWLVDPHRKVGRKLSENKGWEILERYFPKVYHRHSIADPRDPN